VWTLAACNQKEHGRLCVWRDSVSGTVRSWSGFVQCEEMLFPGSPVPVGFALGPCHLLDSLHMRSAIMCVWWGCVWVDRYCVLPFDRCGVRYRQGPVIFDICHLGLWMFAVSHAVCTTPWFAYCGWRNNVCCDGAWEHISWGVCQGSRKWLGISWMLSAFILKTFEDGLGNLL
jgi:hypothetical protein